MKKLVKNKKILKEAGVLLIAAILVLTLIVIVPTGLAAVGPLQGSFNLEVATGANGNAGAEFVLSSVTEPSYFYTTRWASNQIHQYDIDGVLLKEFSILGVSGLRDLAYCPVDGYLYGGAAGGTIWGFDPIDETLEVTLTGSFQCRAIAYDSDLDLFYVSNWNDPVCMVDRITGNVLPTTISLGITTSTYGFAYDNICPGGPYLWVFDQTSPSNAVIYQWKIDTTSPTYGYYTSVTYDVSADFPVSGPDSKAGGLFFTTDYVTGTATLGGCLQGTPDMMFCYKVCDLPLPNDPPVAVNDDYSVCYGSITDFDVLANDNDPDGDPITIVPGSVGAGIAPSLGTAAEVSGKILYTHNPALGYGTDTFDYTIDDGRGGLATAIVTVNVCCIEIVAIRMHPSPAQDKIEVEIKNHCGMNLNGGNRVQLTWEFTIDPNPPCCGGTAYLTDPTNNPMPFVYIETNLLDNCNNGASATGNCRVKGNAFFTLKLTAFVPPTGCSCEKIVTGCVSNLQLC